LLLRVTTRATASSAAVLQGIRDYFKREPVFERVQLLCALAAYHTEAARAGRDPGERLKLTQEAEQFVKQAETLRSSEMLPSMTRGFIAMARVSSCCLVLLFVRLGLVRETVATVARQQHRNLTMRWGQQALKRIVHGI
jgi:hypothetical protein